MRTTPWQREDHAADRQDQNACGLTQTDDCARKTEVHRRSGANGYGVCSVTACRLEKNYF